MEERIANLILLPSVTMIVLSKTFGPLL